MESWKRFLLIGLVLGTASLSCNEKKEEISSKNNLEVLTEKDSLNELKNQVKVDFMVRLRKLDSMYNFNLDDLDKFNYWVDSTLRESAENNSNAIIIDKSDYTLYLIKNGKTHLKYNVELGLNFNKDKQRQGDGRTPEGMYNVAQKKDIGQTDFYRAFLINYPNLEDKSKGKTGGAIEVHGSGSGKKPEEGGYKWTLGCIAMSNWDLDSIFPYIEEKDRITIVKYTTRNLD